MAFRATLKFSRVIMGFRASTSTGPLLVCVCAAAALSACNRFMSPQSRMQLAALELSRGEYHTALLDIQQVTDREPANASAWILETRIALQLGDSEVARQALSAAIAAGAQPSAIGDLRAQAYLAAGEPGRVLKEAAAATLGPQEPDLSVEEGRALAQLHRDTDAESAYRHALAIDPSSTNAATGLAELYVSEGRLDDAASLVAHLLARPPPFAPAWQVRGSIAGRQGRFSEAERDLNTAWQLPSGQLSVPEQAQVLAGLIDARLALGKADAAKSSLIELEKLAPNTLLAQYESARLAMARRDYAAAVPLLTTVVNTDPALVAARFMLGSALLSERQFAGAEHELSRVIAQAPENIEARGMLARARLALGRPDNAIAALSPLQDSTLEQGTGELGMLLGIAQMRAGKQDEAIERLEHVIAADPANYRASLLLAGWYVRRHEPAKASALIDAALRVANGKPDVLASAGALYLEAGRSDRAVAAYRAAVDAEPHNAALRLALARAHLAQNLPQSATDDAETALRVRPDWAPALRVLALVDVSAHKGADMVSRLQAAELRHPGDSDLLMLEGDLRMALRQYAAADAIYSRVSATRHTEDAAIKSFEARQLGHLPNELHPLESWLVLRPDDLGVRRLLAQAYLKAHRDTVARQAYEFIIANDPTDVVSLNNLAWLYQKSGDARAVDTAGKAYRLAPSNLAVADTYGWSLFQAGDLAESLKVLEAAVNEGGDGEIRFHLASALARSGDRVRARAQLERLLHSSPSGFSGRAEAEQLLGRL